MQFPRIYRVPFFIKWAYPSWYIWDKRAATKTIYLTFDDGPIPEVTEWVLDTLSRKFEASQSSKNTLKKIPATFFCIGDNVRKHPELVARILKDGHSVGNHTFNHLNGSITEDDTYLKNTHLAALEMSNIIDKNAMTLSTDLFRPPYGKIKRSQARNLRKLGYKIIMYRIVAYDWEQDISKETSLKKIARKTKNGDIIVLHDSLKAASTMKYILPRLIKHFEDRGFEFGRL